MFASNTYRTAGQNSAPIGSNSTSSPTILSETIYFTVIIESSFVAIERSIQFYVEEKGYDVAG